MGTEQGCATTKGKPAEQEWRGGPMGRNLRCSVDRIPIFTLQILYMTTDTSQAERKPVVSFTLSILCFPPERRQAVGWQWAELAGLCPEGTASLETVEHIRKECLILLF